jgi:hypothetical protein
VDAFMRRFRFSGEESDLDMLLMQKNKSST